jgi:adenylate kinase
MLRALLLAAPGAGKGTQGTRLAARYGVPHLATGDMLRAHVADQTELGREAQVYMDRGELVPDDLVVRLAVGRIGAPGAAAGFVLDGFPRTLAQAVNAYEWAKTRDRMFHAVIVLDVPETELVARLVERGRIAGRSDDTEDTIRNRLAVYRAETQPLMDFYDARQILFALDGTGTIDEVASRIEDALVGRGLAPLG